MSNEVSWDRDSGDNLYFVRFQPGGNVFLTDGSADELWGTGERDATDYAVPMPEKGPSGHYVGDFDASGNIAASDEQGFDIVVYLRVGENPADSDKPIAKGVMHWDGTAKTPELLVATGITAGGTWTVAKLFKIMGAWATGNARDKSGEPGTYEILDPEDGSTVIAEYTPKPETPQKTMVVKI